MILMTLQRMTRVGGNDTTTKVGAVGKKRVWSMLIIYSAEKEAAEGCVRVKRKK